MYAIRTRYLGPTDNYGSRIKAQTHPTGQLSVTISYPHELSGSDCHYAAVQALIAKAAKLPDNWLPVDGWNADQHIETEDSRGYIFLHQ